MDVTDILGLTTAVQVALAAGWIGNAIGSAGFRRDHGPVETVFRTLVYALPATVWL